MHVYVLLFKLSRVMCELLSSCGFAFSDKKFLERLESTDRIYSMHACLCSALQALCVMCELLSSCGFALTDKKLLERLESSDRSYSMHVYLCSVLQALSFM